MKQLLLIISILTALFLCSCAQNTPKENALPSPTANINSDQAKDSAHVSSATDENPIRTPVPAPKRLSYTEAVSDEEKEQVTEFVKKWYEENFTEYKLLSVKLADDDAYLYKYYKDEYEPGEMLVFLVETTHGGEGVYREFCAVKENGEWTFKNEGY